jgi:hypothetical protein
VVKAGQLKTELAELFNQALVFKQVGHRSALMHDF